MWGQRTNHRGRYNNNNRDNGLVMMMLFQIYHQMDQAGVFPPLTIILIAVNVYIHLNRGSYGGIFNFNHFQRSSVFSGLYELFNGNAISSYCLHPQKIIRHWNWKEEIDYQRLLFSGFIHADDRHLYYNMLSFCWKGMHLEPLFGAFDYTVLVAYSLVVSHSLFVIIASALDYAGFDNTISSYNTCAVGFSAVIFSLKYVWTQYSSDGYSRILGFSIPLKQATWAELVIISIISPQSSFLGHLCGILAG